MIVPRSDFDPSWDKRGSEGVQKMTKLVFLGKIGSNRSLSRVGQSRQRRAEVEGVKTDLGKARGGPSMTKNGHL